MNRAFCLKVLLAIVMVVILALAGERVENFDKRKRIRNRYRPRRKPKRASPRRHPRRVPEKKGRWPELPDWMDPRSGVMPPVIEQPGMMPTRPLPPQKPAGDPDTWGPGMGEKIL